MKTLTAIVVAAALAVPSIVSAQRHATPGTADRHATAQKEAQETKAFEANKAERRAENDEVRNLHINGAKAGKLNLAKERAGDGA